MPNFGRIRKTAATKAQPWLDRILIRIADNSGKNDKTQTSKRSRKEAPAKAQCPSPFGCPKKESVRELKISGTIATARWHRPKHNA